MDKTVVPKQSNEITKLSRKEALTQVKRAEKLLNDSRPLKPNIEAYPEPFFAPLTGTVLWFFGLLGSGITYFLFEGVPVYPLLSVAGLGLIQVVIPLILDRRATYGKPFTGIWKPLSYIYATKKQRASAKEHAEVFSAYKESKELYAVLVKKVEKELADSGVFEVLNDVSNPANSKFIHVDSNGKFKYISRKQLEDKQLNETKENQALMKELLMHKLKDTEPLLGT